MVISPNRMMRTAAIRREIERWAGVMPRRAEGTSIMAGTVPRPKAIIISVALMASPAASASDRAA